MLFKKAGNTPTPKDVMWLFQVLEPDCFLAVRCPVFCLKRQPTGQACPGQGGFGLHDGATRIPSSMNTDGVREDGRPRC